MALESMLGKKFSSLSQRMVYTLIATLPGFAPAQCDQAAMESQRQFYGFMSGLLESAYHNPALLGLPQGPDDCYGIWELNNSKPELILQMRAINKSIDEFFIFLCKLGEAGELCGDSLLVRKGAMRMTGKNLPLLPGFGIERAAVEEGTLFTCAEYPKIFPAWKQLCTTIAAHGADPAVTFPRCMFSPNHDYAAGAYAALCGDETLFAGLMEYFAIGGYDRQNGVRLPSCADNGLRIQWCKKLSKKDAAGISIWFDYRKQDPLKFELRVPRFRELLLRFDQMNDRLRDLAIERCKKCDGCGYCVQTDRENRKLMTYPVNHRGVAHSLCPFFPYFTWHGIDQKAAADITDLLDFAEAQLGTP